MNNKELAVIALAEKMIEISEFNEPSDSFTTTHETMAQLARAIKDILCDMPIEEVYN